MIFLNNLNRVALVFLATLFLGACATQQVTTKGDDAYTGTETVKYLADGVPDRVFFSTNKSDLTSAALATLAKQIADGTHYSQQKKSCPYCGVIASKGPYTRHHGDKCRSLLNTP